MAASAQAGMHPAIALNARWLFYVAAASLSVLLIFNQKLSVIILVVLVPINFLISYYVGKYYWILHLEEFTQMPVVLLLISTFFYEICIALLLSSVVIGWLKGSNITSS